MNEIICGKLDIFCHLSWLAEELKLVFIGIYNDILSSIASIFAAIPAPDFTSNIGSLVNNIPEAVWFFASVFEIGYGAVVISSALALRFLIRRTPIIG